MFDDGFSSMVARTFREIDAARARAASSHTSDPPRHRAWAARRRAGEVGLRLERPEDTLRAQSWRTAIRTRSTTAASGSPTPASRRR
jgi:hypothetical protein